MLSGLRDQVDTLFPALTSIAPSERELDDGMAKAEAGRIVKLSGYEAEVFDMHSKKDVAAYKKRMADLSRRVQLGAVRILAHDRQTMHRTDGSTGWYNYLEWMEFTRTEADGSVREATDD